MQKAVACFGSAVRAIQAVVVDHVTGQFSKSARHQQTCNHACKQAARRTDFQKCSEECILCVQGWRAMKSESLWTMARFASGPGCANGAKSFLRWSAPLNRDTPPCDFLSNQRTFVVILSGIVESYLCTYLI
jgi:hypothetical protein